MDGTQTLAQLAPENQGYINDAILDKIQEELNKLV